MTSRHAAAWLRDALVLLAALALMAAAGVGFARLVDQGRPARRRFSREMEAALADAVEASIRFSEDVVDDPPVEAFVGVLKRRLEDGLAVLGPDDEALPDIRVLVVDSPAVNAVAFPGQLVVLYTGLFRAVDDPQALAGVLAHEIGHCVSHDARNALIREVGLSALLASAGAGSAGEAVSEVIRGAVRLRYGRRAEERADRFAVDLLTAARLDPAAYHRALESLADAADEAPEWARYMDVHPPLDRRITEAQQRARTTPSDAEAIRPLEVDWDAVLAALPTDLDPPAGG